MGKIRECITYFQNTHMVITGTPAFGFAQAISLRHTFEKRKAIFTPWSQCDISGPKVQLDFDVSYTPIG